MHIVICEDDPIYQKSIHSKVELWMQKTQHLEAQITVVPSSEDLLDRWERGLLINVLLLDIQFHCEMDGMTVAHHIRKKDESITIVFITNSEAYVYEGYAISALRYLSKPVSYTDIALCLDIAYKQYCLSFQKHLTITDGNCRRTLSHSDILYIEAQSPHLHLVTIESVDPIIIRRRISDVLLLLSSDLFVRCHRSYIVNLGHIRGIKRTELLLSNKQKLPISDTYNVETCNAYDRYHQGDVWL